MCHQIHLVFYWWNGSFGSGLTICLISQCLLLLVLDWSFGFDQYWVRRFISSTQLCTYFRRRLLLYLMNLLGYVLRSVFSHCGILVRTRIHMSHSQKWMTTSLGNAKHTRHNTNGSACYIRNEIHLIVYSIEKKAKSKQSTFKIDYAFPSWLWLLASVIVVVFAAEAAEADIVVS